MAQKIKSTYKKRVLKAEWISEDAREKLADKIDSITFKIGSPESANYPIDSIFISTVKNGASMYQTVLDMYKARHEASVKKQSENFDKTEWYLLPSTVNACYIAASNDVTIPTAMIAEPFYSKNASFEENLGGIGYVIAHEIAHAIDSDGILYDKNGNKTNFLSDEDMKKYKEKCDEVIKLYDGKEALAGIRTDGELTLDENICDLSAVVCITDVLDNNSEKPNYRNMYTNIAKCGFSAYDRDISGEIAKVDVHSPDKLRVNMPLSNCNKFFDAFEISANDGMYVNPERRVTVW